MTPWTVACQASLSMKLPRQEYWSGLPCSPPGDLPDTGIEPTSLMSPALTGSFFTSIPPWETKGTISSVQFSRSVVSYSLQPHELQHTRPPCPSPTPGVHPNSCPLSWMPSSHLILCRPLLLLPLIPPSTRVFSNE